MKSDAGNALFLILIAVALFAALSYAITSSGRGSGDIDKEQASIAAAQIVQYGDAIYRAIQKMKIINGCSDYDISFYLDTEPDLTFYQHTPETRDECKVFHPDGGGVAYQDLLDQLPNMINWSGTGFRFLGSNIYYELSYSGPACSGGNQCYDLIFMVRIPETYCREIAERFEVLEADGSFVNESASINLNRFTGIYGTAPLNNLIGDNAGNRVMADKPQGCFYWPAGGSAEGYYYYNLLISR